MILLILSRIFTYLSNISINKGNRLFFHRFDLISLLFFFIAVVFWLDPNFRLWFNCLQIAVNWNITLGLGIAALPIYTTLFHAIVDGKNKGTIWYFGDGYGNIFEDTVRNINGGDYKQNPKKYIKTSLFIRGFLLFSGLILAI